MSYFRLLKKLEEVFPNRLPDYYTVREDPTLVLKNIGNQEVIGFIRRWAAAGDDDDGGTPDA